MAYNPSLYNPYGTQPFGYQPQPINGLVSVTGLDGAKAYQLPPNSSMPLFDKDNDILYVKTTDGAGFPTVRTFRFEPMEQEQPTHTDYVPRAEFEALVAKVAAMTKEAPDAK